MREVWPSARKAVEVPEKDQRQSIIGTVTRFLAALILTGRFIADRCTSYRCSFPLMNIPSTSLPIST